jgi:hypothetical protein
VQGLNNTVAAELAGFPSTSRASLTVQASKIAKKPEVVADRGRQCAHLWLLENYQDIGSRSTVDIRERYL